MQREKLKISLDSILENVNKSTHEALERLLPRSKNEFLQNISSFNNKDTADFIKINERSYRALSIPLWEILSRKGKGWRSYILKICCEATGHKFSEFRDWLALPEIIHVGSLIIDDIQDSSNIRRGGKACHLLYGIGPAINSGTFAYFIGQKLIEKSALDDSQKLSLYQEYIFLLREAHIGQGLDIAGLELVLVDTISNPDIAFNTVWDIHRRKSGIVFGSFARIGAILGKGTTKQIEVLGDFFEEIGILFQTHDDIINITGFKDNLKQQAEDLNCGKITLPLAIALQNLSEDSRKMLIQEINSKACDPESLVEKLLDAINSTNSIQLCKDLINRRYKLALEKLLGNKCNLCNLENIETFSKRILNIEY